MARAGWSVTWAGWPGWVGWPVTTPSELVWVVRVVCGAGLMDEESWPKATAAKAEATKMEARMLKVVVCDGSSSKNDGNAN